ncbi:CPK2 [Symbiodinium sp. CCMP2592]|nr:CPK2 [Symbiodinium sp. CCMP2592]
MRRLMHEIDVDGRGTVNYTGFIAANISKKQYLQEQVCKAAFHIFDVNGPSPGTTKLIRAWRPLGQVLPGFEMQSPLTVPGVIGEHRLGGGDKAPRIIPLPWWPSALCLSTSGSCSRSTVRCRRSRRRCVPSRRRP